MTTRHFEITGPGVYDGLNEAVYHADTALAAGFGPSLSSTGAKRILHAPAAFKWEQENPSYERKFNVGTAVHSIVLGVGDGAIEYPEEFITKSGAISSKAEVKEWEKAQRENGLVPLKRAQIHAVRETANAVLAHPVAGKVLAAGKPEQSIYATDSDTGVTMRGRIDWLRGNAVIDLKTTGQSAHPWRFAKTCADFGYDLQAAWYLKILAALGYPTDIPYLHVVVEIEPPYLVSVVQLDDESLAAGWAQAERALEIYARCVETDDWPGYPEEITPITLPAYHLNKHL